MKKVYPDALSALADLLSDGMHLCVGGFRLWPIPERLMNALLKHDVRELAIASYNAGLDNADLGRLLPLIRVEDDIPLCWREQGVRTAISRR